MKRASGEPARRAAEKLIKQAPVKPSARIAEIAWQRARRGGFTNPQTSISDIVAYLDEVFGKP